MSAGTFVLVCVAHQNRSAITAIGRIYRKLKSNNDTAIVRHKYVQWCTILMYLVSIDKEASNWL